MKLSLSLTATLVVGALLWGCVGINPDYCDESKPCPDGFACNPTTHGCVPAQDAGPDAVLDLSRDGRPPDQTNTPDAAVTDTVGEASLKPPGASCGQASECASTHCADGVCCDTACSGSCQSCALAASKGTCSAAVKGTDPDGDCSGTHKDCGGSCDGQGACSFAAASTSCGADACSAGQLTTGACDGSGACKTATTGCGGYACDAAGSGCKTSCAGAAQCSGTFQCVSTKCVNSLPNGAACGTNHAACKSGKCVDGYCCDASCSGTCKACDVKGKQGTCSFVLTGTVSAADCPGSGACGPGSCNGAGVCTYPKKVGDSCNSACFGGKQTLSVCDVSHACVAKSPTGCGLYLCDGTNTACRASCSGQTHCTSTAYCGGTTCKTKKSNGAGCASGYECTSASCQATEKVCCDKACSGACESCLLGTKGKCLFKPAGTLCGAADKCLDGATTSTIEKHRCTGSGGTCPKTTTQCTPYKCKTSTTCATSCANNTGCTTKLCDLHDKKNTCPAAGSVCFVDSNASSGSGTQASPYPTINQCLATTKQYVAIASGSYTENLSISGKKVQLVATKVQPSIFGGGFPTVKLYPKLSKAGIEVKSSSDLYLYGFDVAATAVAAGYTLLHVGDGGGSVMVKSSTFHGATKDAAGIIARKAGLSIVDSRVYGNGGAGISSLGETAFTLTDVKVENNVTQGLYCERLCTITANGVVASKNGDHGLYARDVVDLSLNRIAAQDNSGSGLHLHMNSYSTASSFEVSNVLATNNEKGLVLAGNGMSPLNIRNTTVAFNQTMELNCVEQAPSIYFISSVVWDTANGLDQIYGTLELACRNFAYSNVAVQAPSGTGNISALPQFTNPATKDYTLKTTSPCKNKGKPGTTGLPAKDLAGNPRVVGGIVDMGAYEIQ